MDALIADGEGEGRIRRRRTRNAERAPAGNGQTEGIRPQVPVPHSCIAGTSMSDDAQTKTNMFASMIWADFKRGARGERGGKSSFSASSALLYRRSIASHEEFAKPFGRKKAPKAQ
jgi:hypothetical protein